MVLINMLPALIIPSPICINSNTTLSWVTQTLAITAQSMEDPRDTQAMESIEQILIKGRPLL